MGQKVISRHDYRNMGRRPIETIEAGKFVKEQMMTKEAA
jgi:hypothetical protein